MSVTLKEIAQHAGVSFQAVSAVLNNSTKVRVSDDKRRRIMQLVDELGYRPNLLARQLVGKKDKVIGVIIDSMAPAFYRNVLTVIERLSFKHGFRLQVGLVHDNLNSLKKYVDDFIGSQINNVICIAHNYPEFASRVPPLFNTFHNTVFIEEPADATGRAVVAADHYKAYLDTVKYLAGLNRKRIINCRDDYKDKAFTASTRGFKDGFKESSLPYHDEFMFYYPVVSIEDMESAGKLIDAVLPLEPDALILPHDEATMWCYKVLTERGIKVPEQISLVSGDLWKFGKAFSPSLAGIEYDYEEMAKKSVELLMNNMNNSKENKMIEQLILFPAQFVPGDSCSAKNNVN